MLTSVPMNIHVRPATKADARYLAVDHEDLARQHTFRLHPDGRGEGIGPTGPHERFREWKQDLLSN